jgi:hypothetical protein
VFHPKVESTLLFPKGLVRVMVLVSCLHWHK